MAGQANDSEKLPWLEPYREPAGPARRPSPSLQSIERAPAAAAPRAGVPVAGWLVAGIVVVSLAAGGGYWAGHRTAPDGTKPARTVTIPVARVDPIPMPEVEDVAPAAESVPTAPEAKRTRSRTPRSSHQSSAARRTVRAEAPPARPEAAPPIPKVMAVRFSPPPSAGAPGTVVDLGRYLSPKLADSAYRTTVTRYPYLSRLTKVVAPQPVLYGQPRLYALHLGAKNAREARLLCDNLKKIGRPCVVR